MLKLFRQKLKKLFKMKLKKLKEAAYARPLYQFFSSMWKTWTSRMRYSSKDVKKMNSMVEDCEWGSLAFHYRKISLQKNSVKSVIEESRCDIPIYRILHLTAHTELANMIPQEKMWGQLGNVKLISCLALQEKKFNARCAKIILFL